MKERMREHFSTKYVLTKGVKEYRETIPHYVNENDVVVEIGCAWGTTTDILDKYAKKVVGIDKGDSLPTAIETYPHIQFERLDGFDIGSVLKLGYKFTKVYIDISGCRSILDVVKIARMYAAAIKPEVIVIKSTRLKGFVSECTVWETIQTVEEDSSVC